MLQPFLWDVLLEPFVEYERKNVARLVKEYRLTPVLVACSCTGRQYAAIYKNNPGCIGIDNSLKFISYAKLKHPESKIVCADVNYLPFKEQAFKGAIYTYALHDKVPRQRKTIIDETRRVLSDQGMIIITDIQAPHNFKTRFAHIFTYIIEVFSGHFNSGMEFLRNDGLLSIVKENKLEEIFRCNSKIRNAITILAKKI